MSDASALRAEICSLHERRRRGDLPDREFHRRLADREVALLRAVARARIPVEEDLLAEHLVVHGHLELTRSVLREPEQEVVALFLTPRRLLRIRMRMSEGRPVTCDADDTVVDEVDLGLVTALEVRRQIRYGELAAGSVVLVVAIAFHSLLLVTGWVLALLGGLGILHALLLPTRWMEIVLRAGEAPVDGAFLIHALRKKSARNLVRRLREALSR